MRLRSTLIKAAVSAALLMTSSRADAHSFGTGSDAFGAFVEGATAILFSPVALLPCLSLGLLLTLWQNEGMLKAWPILILGQIAGFLVAPMVGTTVVPASVAMGGGMAALAALLPRHVREEAFLLAGANGFATMLVSLEGHGWMGLAIPIYLGIFAGANFAVAAGAGIARMIFERVPYPWMRIGIRIVASWLAAIQVLMVALLLAPSG